MHETRSLDTPTSNSYENYLGDSKIFDIMVADAKRAEIYILEHKQSPPRIVSLGKYLINGPTPFFHNSDLYNEYSVIDCIKGANEMPDVDFIRLGNHN